MEEYQIHKLDFKDEVQYFIPYSKCGIKYRGIAFGKVGFDNEQSFISFVAEYSPKYIDSTPVVGTLSAGKLVDFLISNVKD